LPPLIDPVGLETALWNPYSETRLSDGSFIQARGLR
jgi:hypothetical protein